MEILISNIRLMDEFNLCCNIYADIVFNLNGFIKIKIKWKFFEMAYPCYVEKWLSDLIIVSPRKFFLSENPPMLV